MNFIMCPIKIFGRYFGMIKYYEYMFHFWNCRYWMCVRIGHQGRIQRLQSVLQRTSHNKKVSYFHQRAGDSSELLRQFPERLQSDSQSNQTVAWWRCQKKQSSSTCTSEHFDIHHRFHVKRKLHTLLVSNVWVFSQQTENACFQRTQQSNTIFIYVVWYEIIHLLYVKMWFSGRR